MLDLIGFLAAFAAFIVGNLVWKNYINTPRISIYFPDYSNTLGIKQPQEKNIKIQVLENNENKKISKISSSLNTAKYQHSIPSGTIIPNDLMNTTTMSYEITQLPNGTATAISSIYNKTQKDSKIQIFTLEVNNKGMSAARNALLYFNINGINKICKWNSVPEPLSNLYLYDIYQRLTLLRNLHEGAAFAFRFIDDSLCFLSPYDLMQYNLIPIYNINTRETIEKYYNKINYRDKNTGELIIYSEEYKGKCGISFSYDNKNNKIKMELHKLKLRECRGFKRLHVDKNKNTLDISLSNENKK